MRSIPLFFLCLAGLAGLATAQAQSVPSLDQFQRCIQVWEGYTIHPVVRPNGEMVVGWGHNCAYDLTRPLRHTYSETDLYVLYQRDYYRTIAAARDGIRDFDLLPPNVQCCVLSLIWCVGPTGFQRFTAFRTCLSHRLYTEAAMELQQSTWAHQIGLARLKNHVIIIRNTPSSRLSPTSP